MRHSLITFSVLLPLFCAAPAHVQATSDAPRISCAEAEYDFGEKLNTFKGTHVFTLRNEGGTDLRITRLRHSCGCLQLKMNGGVDAPGATIIPPGSTAKLEVDYTLELRKGTQNFPIVVSSNDPVTPHLFLAVKGVAVAGVDVIPVLGVITFRPGETSAPECEFELNPLDGKKFNVVGCETGSARLAASTEDAGAGLPRKVKVRLTGGMWPMEENIETDLSIRTDHPDYALIKVPVVAQFIGDIDVFPHVIEIDGNEQEMVTRRVTLRNLKGGRLELLSVVPPTPGITVDSGVDASWNHTLTVRNIPPAKGLDGKRLLLRTNYKDYEELSVRFKIR